MRDEHAPQIGPGAEQLLQSQALRLRGRADRVRRLTPEILEVRDFKSGATLDQESKVKPEIALQLMAYGLMVLERHPNTTIRLIVDDGEERNVAFHPVAREQARETLRQLVNGLPPAGIVSGETLANPGSSCRNCPYRHTCSAYLTIAPTWWKSYPNDVEYVPFDIWGTLTEIRQIEDLASARLTDAGCRRVRVDGLDRRHGVSLAPLGSTLFFFGLQATGPSWDFDGGRFHPRSFHEIPRDRWERRAWTATSFSIEPC
nr:PD-(D/E)XK nuclease family protein [Lysobacter sp. Root983]